MVKNMSVTLPEEKQNFLKDFNTELERKLKYKVGVSNVIEVCVDAIASGTFARATIEKAIRTEFLAQKKAKATKRYMTALNNINSMSV